MVPQQSAQLAAAEHATLWNQWCKSQVVLTWKSVMGEWVRLTPRPPKTVAAQEGLQDSFSESQNVKIVLRYPATMVTTLQNAQKVLSACCDPRTGLSLRLCTWLLLNNPGFSCKFSRITIWFLSRVDTRKNMQLFGMDEERIRYILTQPSYKNRG
jgi:hypothetical protein